MALVPHKSRNQLVMPVITKNQSITSTRVLIVKKVIPALLVCMGLSIGVASAHGPAGHSQMHKTGPAEQMDWGIAGDPKRVNRTVAISMTDDMRFTPAVVEVKLDETVRFVIKNDGKILHEMVIGSKDELDKHAAMMEKFPNMAHDEAYMAHVDPGKSGDIVWRFNRAGEFDFACLLPGHYKAGMVGKIKVVKN
jgi:uncharacterized cupredoxin-like copper-binding protein